MCEVTKLDKIRTERMRDNGGENRKESTGNEVGVVLGCDEKRGALRKKEGDLNDSTGETKEGKT